MIKISLQGRLGNQMFQYSLIRLIAEKNNFNFTLTSKEEIGIQNHISNFFPDLYLGKEDGEIKYTVFEDSAIQKYNPDLFNISDFTFLNGFFQSDLYFTEYEDKIKNWFNVLLDNETKKLIDKYPIDKHCFIHVRGTDYSQNLHWLLGENYYRNAIQNFKKKYPNISFLVITDDIEYSKKILPDIECINNNMMVDFKLLYFSKYKIISNSTFSWWASWLSNDTITIAPNYWLNYNHPELGFYPIDIKTTKFEYV